MGFGRGRVSPKVYLVKTEGAERHKPRTHSWVRFPTGQGRMSASWASRKACRGSTLQGKQGERRGEGRQPCFLEEGDRLQAPHWLLFPSSFSCPLRPICPQGLLCSNPSQRESRGQERSKRTHPSVDRELLDDLLLGGSSFRGVGLGGLSLGKDGRGGERSGDGGCSDGLGGGAAKREHDH